MKMLDIKKLNLCFMTSCLMGSLLSYYAYVVEVNVEADHNYVALCDISQHISCTKAFSSKYGKGFGIIGPIFGEDSVFNQPNSFGGIFFYLVLAFICLFESARMIKLQIILCAISNLLSVYLAYILYFILYDFCIICVTTYVINLINLALSLLKWKRFKEVFTSNLKPGNPSERSKSQ